MLQTKSLFFWLITALCLTACIKEGTFKPDSHKKTQEQATLPRALSRVAPILRIDTGMHTAIIKKMDVDAAERYLVTGSDDKTVRVWSLSDGRLLRVLRPPMGKGHEGKVYAVAISPHGETVAVGGWTSKSGLNNAIYLFNSATGELRQRITGLPNRILHLAYSPDGSRLVASLRKGGIRLYQTSDYRLQAQDTDYKQASYWAEFDSNSRLVTTCKDGYIRLYNQKLKLLAKRKAAGGRHPYAARFSPAGDKIAVGFQDSTHINVLSSKDLILLYRPNTQGVNKGSLDNLAWSQDGNWLYAGGRYYKGTKVQILRWSQAGQGQYSAWPASSNTIMGIRALRNGRIVFGTAEPDFGIFDANGQKILERHVDIADFRAISDGHFLISKDGSIVQFGYEYGGKKPARFSLKERTLILEPPASSKLIAPRLKGLKITNWQNSTQPKLNGKALSLKPDEIVRSLAITPDGRHFLLGTQWFLRFFDKQGKQRWKTETPSIAWGINIAGNGKVAIAAFGDGTLRWYRLRDGEELLAFFPHKDGKRWIVWTPQGYYAASSGGEALIGWQLNQGPAQAADFFPAARFRDNYYRPALVAKVLDSLEATRKKQQTIQKQLPPVVTLLSPQDGATFSDTKLELRYRIRRPSKAPITGIKVLIDGRPLLENTKGLVRQEESSLQITLPSRDVKVSLIAENKYAASEAATIQLRWQGASQSVNKPTLYVLAVGVSKYESVQKLRYADQDAQDLAQLFNRQKNKGLYRDIQVKLLKNANKEEILDGLDWIEQQTTQNDIAVIAFAGHGVNDKKGRYYFLPREVNIKRLKSTAVAYHDIKDTMVSLRGKALFFIDTCHSANLMGGVADVNRVANDLSTAENGIVVFTGSTGTQQSVEHSRWQNGAFTEALLEGLKGQADYHKDGLISITELELYLSHRVKELAGQYQTPTTAKPHTIVDFPIVKLD